MFQAAQTQDGYEMVAGHTLWDELSRGRPAGKFKWCTRLARFVKEPGEEMITTDALPNDRSEYEFLVGNGSLPTGRYYAFDSGQSNVYVSVGQGERAEFAKNIEAGQVCLWTEGNPQAVPSHDGNGGMNSKVFHVVISKWDGILRPHAQAPTSAAAPGTAP